MILSKIIDIKYLTYFYVIIIKKKKKKKVNGVLKTMIGVV